MTEQKDEPIVLKRREMDHPIFTPKLTLAAGIMAVICLAAIVLTWLA